MPIFSGIDPAKKVSSSNKVSLGKIVAPLKPVSEPIPQHPATRKLPGRNVYSTPSIMDALREDVKIQDKYEKPENSETQSANDVKAHTFTQEELVKEWKNFVANVDAAQLKSALGAREPLLTEGWQIEYELDTELQLNRLTLDLKPKLLGYLRNRFRNDAIEIQFKISESTESKSNMPYTEAERWSSLVEKYPALAMLKSKFGLDFEQS